MKCPFKNAKKRERRRKKRERRKKLSKKFNHPYFQKVNVTVLKISDFFLDDANILNIFKHS